MYWVSALPVGVFSAVLIGVHCDCSVFSFVGGYPVSVSVLFVSPAGGAGFNYPAKLVSRPRMRVLPHFSGTFYFPFMLSLGSMDIALRPLCRLKHKKNFTDEFKHSEWSHFTLQSSILRKKSKKKRQITVTVFISTLNLKKEVSQPGN